MSDPTPYPGEAIAHTVVTHAADGVVHVQQLGAAHVVEVDRWITLRPGEVLGVRHLGTE